MNASAPPSGHKPKRLVGDQFVVGEAVVQFDDADILGADAGLLVDLVRGGARHVVADQPHHVLRYRRCYAVSVVIACAAMATSALRP